MPQPGEGQGPAAAEQARTVERFSVGENSARLGNQRDAVCDGRTAQLSSLERKRNDTPDQAQARQKNADALATRVAQLKKPGGAEPLFTPPPPTADRLLNLDKELAKLTQPDTGRFAGLLVNIQGARTRDTGDGRALDASSVGMVALVDYLTAHQNDPGSQADILKGAYGAVRAAYQALGLTEEPVFAAALIDSKSGEMVSVRSKDVAIVVVDDDAQPADRVKQVKASTLAANGEPSVETRTVKKGEKIILCGQEAVEEIGTDKKPITEIVDSLTKPKDQERERKPIDGNIVYARHATIIPDVHGGKEMGDPTRTTTESPLSAFIGKGRKGELFVSAGDVFDRGGQSWEAAQQMMDLVRQGDAMWNWGNHELLFMGVMSGDKSTFTPANAEALTTWFLNGGDQMARAAGVDMTAYDQALATAGDRMAFFRNGSAREACWQAMLPALRANQNLNTLSTFLEQHGKAYTIVDNVLVTHAGVLADPQTGRLIDVVIDGQNFGKGLDAMDAIQARVRQGDAKVINWLANHGGDDNLNKDNPFWVREQNFQEVAQTPTKAHVLREELNAQMQGKTRIELIVVGHTPVMGDTAGRTMPLADGSEPTRFIFADTGYHDQGEPRVVRLTVPADASDQVTAVYSNPETGKRPRRADGKAVADMRVPMDRKLPRAFTHGAAAESVDSKKTTAPRKEKAPAPEPKTQAPEPGGEDQEADTEVEAVRHKPPFWADKKDEPVRANEYIKSAAVLTNLTQEQLRTRGIDAQTPGVSLVDRGNGRYDAVINIFQANRAWARGAMDALHGSDTTNLPVAEQKKLLQQIQEQLSWEQDNDQNPARATILAVEHPLAKAFTHSQTADQIMTVEVMMRQFDAPSREQLAATAREALVKGLRARLGQEAGVAARGKVVHRGEQISEEGDFQKLFTEAGVNETVRRDMAAADLMLDACGDLKVNPAELALQGVTVPEGTTYQDARRLLTDAITAAAKSGDKEARAQALRVYNQFRLVFYGHVHDALSPRGTLSARSNLGQQIRDRIESFDLQKAIEGYHGKRGKNAFDGLEGTSVKDMALKGMEMYIRLIKDPINLEVKPQEPDLGIIYNKQFIQSEAEALQYLQPPKRKDPRPPAPKPPGPPKPPPGPPRGEDDDGGSEDDDGGGKGKKKPEPAPRKPRPEGGDDLPPGPPKEGEPGLEGGPKPAPTGEQDRGPKPVDPAPPGHTPPTPQPLPMSANLGAGAAQNAGAQNIVQLADHVGSADLARMKKPFYAKIPLLGGVLYSIRHPIKLIWQNNLARSVFEQQRVRFAADFRNIVKGATDQSVPVDVSPQLMDLALAKGREMRKNSGLFRRMAWGASDFVKGITGLSQTSEMILAKKWLRNEMVGTRRTQWSADLQRVTSNILSEQTNLGERFALLPKEWTLEQANAHALTYQGETRRSLMADIEGGADGEQARGVNRELRAMVEAYCTGNPPMTQEQLVANINKYLKSDAFRNLLPADQRRMMQTSELATNIINIAEMVKGRWSEYNAAAEGGGRVFDKFTFNVLYGKAEWGGVRGHRETGFLTEILARRLAERSVGGAELGYAASLANDVLTYGGAFAAGWGVSTLNTFLNKIPRGLLIGGLGPIGGVLGMGVMSTVKETGFSIPLLNKIHWNWGGHEFHPFTYIGRTAKDAGQASREAARGALEGAKGTIRSEMERTLVKRKEAPALTSSVESMLQVPPENMTDEQAMQLLTTLADIDARMRLSDLSGTIHMNYHTQNYLGFTGGQENAQYLALKKTLLDGIVRLQAYGTSHPTFMQGQGPMFTGVSMQYGQRGQNLGLFEKMSALAEAQLRVSSDVDVVNQWMRRELRMSDAEATAFMRDFFAEQKMVSATTESDSLRTKEGNLRKLTLKRGASTLVKSVLMAPVAGAIYGGVSQVISTGATEIGEAIKEGPQHWAEDWGKVLSGNVPVEVSASGHLVSDMTPLQQQFILARNIIEPPVDFRGGLHETNIDGINIMVPGYLRYFSDGNGHDGLIDLRNGTVARDMSGIELHGDVVGGHSVLVYTDAAGNHVAGDPIADFKAVGIDIKPLDPLHGTETADIWTPAATTQVQTVEGHQVTVPANAEWKYDATTHAWDLKATDGHGHVQTAPDGHEVTLIQDAEFGPDGRIVSVSEVHSGVVFADGTPRLEGGGVTVEHHDVIGPDGRWDEASGRYGFTFMKGAGTSMQDYKGTNSAGEPWYQVHAGGSTATAPDGTVYSISDAAANHQLGFAIQIPGHGTFLVPPNQGNTDLRLDPADTNTFRLADGSQMTYGELARMVINQDALKAQPDGFLGTEWKHHTDVLALKPDGREWGSISSVIVPNGTVTHPQGYVYNGPPVDTNGMITSPGTHMDGSVLAYAAVRGTAPASEQSIEITHGTPPVEVYSPVVTAAKISDTVETLTPVFESTATSTMTYTLTPPGLFPMPLGRENIEKAEYGSGSGTSSGTDSSGSGSSGGSSSGQGGTQPPPAATETGVRVPAMKPEEMVALAKLKIKDKDKQKENGPYQAELLPALAEFEVVMESGNEGQIEAVRKKVVKALKSCRSEDPEAAARTIERAIRDKQSVSETEKQARIAAKKKEDEAKKKETDRATELMRVMGIELRTAKEREVGSPTLKHFETIMAEMKIYVAAFEKNDTATLTESSRKLKALLRTEWGVKKEEEQDAKMEMLRAQLEREREIAIAAKAKAEQDAAQEQLRQQQEEQARRTQQEQSGSATGAAST